MPDYRAAIVDPKDQGDLLNTWVSFIHFLGTIVTIPRTTGYLEVVDGQQRLATAAILLAAIRDFLKGKEDVLVESINNEFLTGIDRTKRGQFR